jgi:hypothetical protein
MIIREFWVVMLRSRLLISDVPKKPSSRFKDHGIPVAASHDLWKVSLQVIFISSGW